MLQNHNVSRLFVLLTAVLEGVWLWRATRKGRHLSVPTPSTVSNPRGDRMAASIRNRTAGDADEVDDIKRAWQALWRKLDERDNVSS
jgi:hypothetical protein